MAILLRLRAPTCLVLSISELPQTQPIEVLAVIGDEADGLNQDQTSNSVESLAA